MRAGNRAGLVVVGDADGRSEGKVPIVRLECAIDFHKKVAYEALSECYLPLLHHRDLFDNADSVGVRQILSEEDGVLGYNERYMADPSVGRNCLSCPFLFKSLSQT